MNGIIAGHFARLALGPAQVHRNIVVFPLIGPDAGPAPYLTLGEALSSQCLIVTEVSDGGSVPELKVISQSDRPILLLDEKAFESVGYGRDYRYQRPGLAGSALVHEDRVVHLAFFRLPKTESAGGRMSSLRQRRRRFSQ